MSSREGKALLAILTLGMCLRLAWLFYAKPTPFSDYEHYRLLAEGLLDHHQYGYPNSTAFRTPGYPFFLATLMMVSRSVAWLGLVNVILSTTTCALVFFLARILFGRKDVALGASLVCALNPSFVFRSPILASENLFTPLILGVTLLALTRTGTPYLRAALCGLLLGASILTRAEAIFYVPVICGCFLWHPKNSLQPRARTGVVYVSLVIVATAFMVLPWYVRNLAVMGPGAGLSTVSGVVFYFGHNPENYGWVSKEKTPFGDMREVERSREGYRLGLEYIKSHPESLLRSMIFGTYNLYVPFWEAVRASATLLRSPGEPRKRKMKSLVFLRPAKFLNLAGDGLLLSMAVLSLLTIRSWPLRSAFIIASFVFFNWICYAVVFHATPRYRCFPEALFSICSGIVLARLIDSDVHGSSGQNTQAASR